MSLNVQLIRESFNAIKPHAEDVMVYFYEQLFQRYPAAQKLFKKTDMKRQRMALANGLAHIVEYLDEPDHLKDYLKKMGTRHYQYGTKEEHFPWVGETLLATFAYFFDDQWTDELKAAWLAVYEFGAAEMTKGLRQAEELAKSKKAEAQELPDLARVLAKDLFKKALDQEFNDSLMAIARERVRDVLRKALEQEAKQVLNSVKKNAA